MSTNVRISAEPIRHVGGDHVVVRTNLVPAGGRRNYPWICVVRGRYVGNMVRQTGRRTFSLFVAAAILVPAASSSAGSSDEPTPPDQEFDVPTGEWTGVVFLQGTRNRSGLSAVGQPTDIYESVTSSSIGLDLTMGDGVRKGYVESGSATVSIDWTYSGTFSQSTGSETGTLELEGDVTRIEATGTLTRSVDVSDSSGNPLPDVSGSDPIEVTWVFELADATCGQFQYRLAEGTGGGSMLSWAVNPSSVTTGNGFVITHDLTVAALLQAPGGPDFTDLALRLQQLADTLSEVIADPTEDGLVTIVFHLQALEQLRSDLVATGNCLNTGQLAFVSQGQLLVQSLVSQLLGALLERAGELPLDVLVDALGIGVRSGAVIPGFDGQTGDQLWAAFGVELDSRLFLAIAAEDWDTISDIAVTAAQYGYDQIAVNAAEALGQEGAAG